MSKPKNYTGYEVFFSIYDDEGVNILRESSIFIRAENESKARRKFVEMLPINEEFWLCRIDFCIKIEVTWD